MADTAFQKWFKTFSLVNKLFQDKDIEHVFIKMLLNPFHMRDVDVLIPNVEDEKIAIELLKKEGFRPYRAGRLLHPWKIICDGGSINHLCVDLHNEAEWNRTRIGDSKDIVSRRRTVDISGTKAYLPSPEDSFYLIATHAYYQHLTITRAEVLNAIHITKSDFSWSRVFRLTEEYGTFESVYAFLKAMKLENPTLVNEKILSMFARGGSKYVDRWMSGIKTPKFPLYLPRWLGCIIPSFIHTPALIGKIKPEDLAYDFLSHYMRLVGERGGFETQIP